MEYRKKQFVVEVEIPEGCDAVWDNDDTGLNALHDCVITPLHEINLHRLCDAFQSLKKEESEANKQYMKFVERNNAVRKLSLIHI